MPKVKSRMAYSKDMQDEIQAVVMYAYEQIQSLTRINLKLHTIGQVWFPDTMDGHREKRKLEDKEEKAVKLYKELDSYTKQARYADIYRSFLSDLRDEDDSEEWGRIFHKYRQDVLDLKIDLNRTHQDFLTLMADIFHVVAEQKKQEREYEQRKERESEMKETSIETLAQNEEAIRQTLYEKCNAGELSVEQREAALSQLSAYVDSADNFVEAVNQAVEDYCEGTINCDELDNIVSGYYTEHPQQALYYEGAHIDNRFDAMKNEVVGLYNCGVLTLEDAEEYVNYLDALYDIQMYEHVQYLHNEGVPCLESMVSEAMDDYFGTIREFKESAGDESDLETRMTALEAFTESTWQYFGEEAFDVAVFGTIGAVYLACIGVILSIPIGRAINNKKGKKLIDAYEYLHPSAVKYSDLTISKMSIERTASQYIPEIKTYLDRSLRTNGKCYVAKYKGKVFAVIASIRYETTYSSTDSYGVDASKSRYYFKAISPEAQKHATFYEAALMLRKFKVNTPEIKEFAKDMKSDLEALKKKEEKAAKTAAKKASGIKESVEDESFEEATGDIARKITMDPYVAAASSDDTIQEIMRKTGFPLNAKHKHDLNKVIKRYEKLYHPEPTLDQLEKKEITDEKEVLSKIKSIRDFKKKYDPIKFKCYKYSYKGKPLIYYAVVTGTNSLGQATDPTVQIDWDSSCESHIDYYVLGIVSKNIKTTTTVMTKALKEMMKKIKEEEKALKKASNIKESVEDESFEEMLEFGESPVDPMIIGVLGAFSASLLATAIGKAYDKKMVNKMLRMYEKLYDPRPTIAETTIVGMQKPEILKCMPDAQKYDKKYDSTSMVGARLMYKKEVVVYSAQVKGVHSDGAESTPTILFSTKPGVSKYDDNLDYYILGLMTKKLKVMTPEIKGIIKSMIQRMKSEQRAAKASAKHEKKEAKSVEKAKVAKECAGIESVDLTLYEEVLENILEKYESGQISLDMKEACIMEARDRIFGEEADLVEESFLSDCRKKVECKMAEKRCDGDIKQMQAKYLANNAEIKRVQKEINDLERMQSQRNIDPITSKRAADKIKKLQQKVKKLSDEAQRIYTKISMTDLNQSKTRAFDNYNKKLKSIASVNA